MPSFAAAPHSDFEEIAAMTTACERLTYDLEIHKA